MTSTSVSALMRDTDNVFDPINGDNDSVSTPSNKPEDGVLTTCRTCLSTVVTCQCCGTMSTVCSSASTNFKWFFTIAIVAFLWFLLSIAIVSSDRSNYWSEFEKLIEEENGVFLNTSNNNATIALLRNTMAISLKYTESMSIFYVFSTLISAMLYGTLFGMLIHRFAELYPAHNNRYEFTNDVPVTK